MRTWFDMSCMYLIVTFPEVWDFIFNQCIIHTAFPFLATNNTLKHWCVPRQSYNMPSFQRKITLMTSYFSTHITLTWIGASNLK